MFVLHVPGSTLRIFIVFTRVQLYRLSLQFKLLLYNLAFPIMGNSAIVVAAIIASSPDKDKLEFFFSFSMFLINACKVPFSRYSILYENNKSKKRQQQQQQLQHQQQHGTSDLTWHQLYHVWRVWHFSWVKLIGINPNGRGIVWCWSNHSHSLKRTHCIPNHN